MSLTQNRCAMELQISRSAYSAFELGERRLKAAMIIRLLQLFRESAEEMIVNAEQIITDELVERML